MENRHYRGITFRENSARIKLLAQFKDLINDYFSNSTLNMLEGTYTEKQPASEAKAAINLIIKKAYHTIRLADIKTSAASISSVAIGIKDQNIDLVLNIFNLGRHNIAPETALDFIEDAIDVYKSNRLSSLVRTVNPLFWLKVLFHHIVRGKEEDVPGEP